MIKMLHAERRKICSKCQECWRRKGQRRCRNCHAAHMRDWRKTHPLNPAQRKKMNCRAYANVYLRRGKIERRPCSICGARAEMHHPDYDKPLLIEWYCRKHHLDLHRNRSATTMSLDNALAAGVPLGY